MFKTISKYVSVFLILTCFSNTVLRAQTNVSGVISTNTTWTKSNSPYIVTGNVLVNTGVTLIIDAGVEIRLEASKYLKIEGEIKAIGQINDSIIFTSNSSNKIKGSWDKVWLKGTASSYQSNYEYTSVNLL
jgi:lipopolysaccharide export system protein LptA